MSKALWLIAGVAGLAWLVAQDGPARAPASAGYLSTTASGSSIPGTESAAVIGAGAVRYSTSVSVEDEDDQAEEVRQAKQQFEDAAEELRSAVDDLRINRWSGQMSTIRSRLEDADDALSNLESLRSGDPAVQSARDELDTMRSHMSQLHHENWRTVRPDLGTSATAIEDQAGAVTVDDDE